MSLSKGKFWYSNNCLHFLKCVVPLGLNEADTSKSSSILIYQNKRENIYISEIFFDAEKMKKTQKEMFTKVVADKDTEEKLLTF